MINIIYEITQFDKCEDLKQFTTNINKLCNIFSDNSIVSNYITYIKDTFKDIIENVIHGEHKDVTDSHISSLVLNGDTKYSFFIENKLPVGNDTLYGYKYLKYVISNSMLENCDFYTFVQLDYISMCLCLYNHLKDINKVYSYIHYLFSQDDVDNYKYNDTVVYISRCLNMGIISKTNCKYIYLYLLRNGIEVDFSYKESVLKLLTPLDIIQVNDMDEYILCCCSYVGCDRFTLNGKLLSYHQNWLNRNDITIQARDNELIKKLKLFELEHKYISEKCYLLTNYKNDNFNDNIREYFNKLNIYKCSTMIKFKEYKLDSILIPIRSRATKSINQEAGQYPLITSINSNNGIKKFINIYDYDTGNNETILSIGLRKSGVGKCFAHNYKFAHTNDVSIFKLRQDCKLNPYNIAFSITKYYDEHEHPESLTTKDIIETTVEIIID